MKKQHEVNRVDTISKSYLYIIRLSGYIVYTSLFIYGLIQINDRFSSSSFISLGDGISGYISPVISLASLAILPLVLIINIKQLPKNFHIIIEIAKKNYSFVLIPSFLIIQQELIHDKKISIFVLAIIVTLVQIVEEFVPQDVNIFKRFSPYNLRSWLIFLLNLGINSVVLFFLFEKFLKLLVSHHLKYEVIKLVAWIIFFHIAALFLSSIYIKLRRKSAKKHEEETDEED